MIVRVVDIETTGEAPPLAEVIELGCHDVACQPDGSEARMVGEQRAWLFGSVRPCPPEVLAVHHILDRERAGEPIYCDALASDLMGDPALYGCAHNAEFEQMFVAGLFERWICTYKVALRVWPDAPKHSNQALCYWLGLHEELDEQSRHPPHRAGPDAHVTAAILVRLLRTGVSLEDMVAWSVEPRLMPTCPIGKFRGRPWPEVERGFLEWMLRQADMERDLRWNAQRELRRRRDAQQVGE